MIESGNDAFLRADHSVPYLLDDLQHSVSAAFGVVGVETLRSGVSSLCMVTFSSAASGSIVLVAARGRRHKHQWRERQQLVPTLLRTTPLV